VGAILALDLATVTGWAIGVPGGEPVAGSHRIAEPGAALGRFLAGYSDWLADRITVLEPCMLIFEAPILTGHRTALDTARKLMCLAGVTELIAHRREIPCYEADTGEVTKHFTGRARYPGKSYQARRAAKKRSVMDQCAALGWRAADDNAADALALWTWAEFKLSTHRREMTPLLRGRAA